MRRLASLGSAATVRACGGRGSERIVSGRSGAIDRLRTAGVLAAPHHPPKAKRVIYLFMSGGPSQLDLFDYKPLLNEMNGQDLPDSVREGQRLTGMTGNQATLAAGRLDLQVRPARQVGRLGQRALAVHGEDRRRPVRHQVAVYTEAINHDPAITFFQTGSQLAGRPQHRRLAQLRPGHDEREPAGLRRADHARRQRVDQPLYARLWGNGFLPSMHQGVQFRAGRRPGALPRQSRRASRAAGRPQDARPPAPSCTSCEYETLATRRSRPASPSTRWPSACRPACRS